LKGEDTLQSTVEGVVGIFPIETV